MSSFLCPKQKPGPAFLLSAPLSLAGFSSLLSAFPLVISFSLLSTLFLWWSPSLFCQRLSFGGILLPLVGTPPLADSPSSFAGNPSPPIPCKSSPLSAPGDIHPPPAGEPLLFGSRNGESLAAPPFIIRLSAARCSTVRRRPEYPRRGMPGSWSECRGR